MKREPHVRFCEGLGCNSLGLLTYGLFAFPIAVAQGRKSGRPLTGPLSSGARNRDAEAS